jgi:hypothetical protein
MLLIRNFRIHLAGAALALLASQPAAKASFIMSPMAASLSSGAPYPLAAPAGKPALRQQKTDPSDLTDGLLRGDLLGPVPLSLPVGTDQVVRDGEPKTVLPEPATIAVLGAGLLSLAFLRRAGA